MLARLAWLDVASFGLVSRMRLDVYVGNVCINMVTSGLVSERRVLGCACSLSKDPTNQHRTLAQALQFDWQTGHKVVPIRDAQVGCGWEVALETFPAAKTTWPEIAPSLRPRKSGA